MQGNLETGKLYPYGPLLLVKSNIIMVYKKYLACYAKE